MDIEKMKREAWLEALDELKKEYIQDLQAIEKLRAMERIEHDGQPTINK